MDIPVALQEIRARAGLTQERLAQALGVSFVSVNRWERGASDPSPALARKIFQLHRSAATNTAPIQPGEGASFASRGVRSRRASLPLFEDPAPEVRLHNEPFPPILERVTHGRIFSRHPRMLKEIVEDHKDAARTRAEVPTSGMSAGKNTYTYDAHTYHTKVPPQGIAELLRHYLPDGGLVLDLFAGSGMTGVAATANGYDCILNELSPAACFIADRFTSTVDPMLFAAGVKRILAELADVRRALYTTTCRECGRETELLYAVWSYRVVCSKCEREFVLWDACRSYGARVKEHKILTEFPCPTCNQVVIKSRLKRTVPIPVQVGYKCCGSRQQEVTHSPNQDDLERILAHEVAPPLSEGFFPVYELPDGVNLNQPKRHGLNRIDRFYTGRNLAAMSQLWRAIHRVEDVELAAHLAFVFTSLYQRVTRLSEFRFWGGSGNTAHFNVPFICNEANVFVTFARKARSIQDHLETTASDYRGRVVVVENTATRLDFLPDNSVDFIFTDPPFGANINYSEMNVLWESWLGRFTDTASEAIVNRAQKKDVHDYRRLMTESLHEAYRVLRPGHWMLLVFMNTNAQVWEAIRSAIREAGFVMKSADIFDKQHGTFKQFVSENCAGFDIVFHCQKPFEHQEKEVDQSHKSASESVIAFLETADVDHAVTIYLHVKRDDETDFRKLYSEWIAATAMRISGVMDFASFRQTVINWLESRKTAN